MEGYLPHPSAALSLNPRVGIPVEISLPCLLGRLSSIYRMPEPSSTRRIRSLLVYILVRRRAKLNLATKNENTSREHSAWCLGPRSSEQLEQQYEQLRACHSSLHSRTPDAKSIIPCCNPAARVRSSVWPILYEIVHVWQTGIRYCVFPLKSQKKGIIKIAPLIHPRPNSDISKRLPYFLTLPRPISEAPPQLSGSRSPMSVKILLKSAAAAATNSSWSVGKETFIQTNIYTTLLAFR